MLGVEALNLTLTFRIPIKGLLPVLPPRSEAQVTVNVAAFAMLRPVRVTVWVAGLAADFVLSNAQSNAETVPKELVTVHPGVREVRLTIWKASYSMVTDVWVDPVLFLKVPTTERLFMLLDACQPIPLEEIA
jgi:hypothetical protein